jgi:hypothetical protein
VKIRIRKGKLRFVRNGGTRVAFDYRGGAWVTCPVSGYTRPDVVLKPDSPVIGLGECSETGYVRVLTNNGPLWVRAMDLSDGPEPSA